MANKFHEQVKMEVAHQIENLARMHREELKLAWARTVGRKTGNGGRLLIPFVGSGLNRLSASSAETWKELVGEVKKVAALPHTPHTILTSRLTYPEQLELYLSACKETRFKKFKILKSFQKMFDVPKSPSSFHSRLAKCFPYIITTNYDTTLTKARPKHVAIDLTDPDQRRHFEQKRAILHLHGCWDANNETARRLQQIFRGVGIGSAPDEQEGPCLVLTEHQYHRLYAQSPQYQRAVQKLFNEENLLMFMGSGLSGDESGIHQTLRDLQLTGRETLMGIYVGIDVNRARIELLRNRGLATISLPGHFGWKRDIEETVWHAFLDKCESLFGSESTSTDNSGELLCPDILCAGIASRQITLALGQEFRSLEATYFLHKDQFSEEAAGQHLFPALELARRGHRVALATVLGEDNDGDWVLEKIGKFVRSEECRGDIDTQLVLKVPKAQTRRTYSVTFPTQAQLRKPVRPRSGTRVLFDYEGVMRGRRDWLNEFVQHQKNDELSKLLRLFHAVQALYLGPSGGKIQKKILQTVVKDLKKVRPYRFLETGTMGSADVLKLAGSCTHILSSAEFIYWLTKKKIDYDHMRKCGADFQHEMWK